MATVIESEYRSSNGPRDGQFVSNRQAALRLGRTAYDVLRMSLAGKIRVQMVPGKSPRFHWGDVERLAEELGV